MKARVDKLPYKQLDVFSTNTKPGGDEMKCRAVNSDSRLSTRVRRSLYIGSLILLCVSLLLGTVACTPTGQLTAEEKLEDWQALVGMLEENYPYFGVMERKNGFDWLARQDAYAKRLQRTRTDLQFAKRLSAIVAELRQGHTGVITPPAYGYMVATYVEHVNTLPQLAPWVETLNQPLVQERYADWGKHFCEQAMGGKTQPSGLRTGVIEPDKIAYLRVTSFAHDNIEADQPKILQFLQDVSSYPYLIIDIRGNSGGSDFYWRNNILAPLLAEPLQAVMRTALRGGEYGMSFMQPEEIAALRPIAELPSGLDYPPELQTDFRYFSEPINLVEAGNSVGFQGEVYLLVDDKVFSAAEAFASFAKATGWATLVGQATAGDGGSGDPLPFALPNSGLIVRFPLKMMLNPDGTSNYEVGTVPDILVPPGADALQVVLDLLNSEEG